MKNILIIGGTGIIGNATIIESIKNNFNVTTISLEKDFNISESVNQKTLDRKNKKEFQTACSELNKETEKWDIVFDIASFDREDAKQTYECFKDSADRIFTMSTTLVYDRSKPTDLPIKSSHPLARKETMGGYVDKKLDLENFWHQIDDVNWTILRAYHIVGPQSLLGCIPSHNRDPKILETIKSGGKINLCNNGNIFLNYIHPSDIAKIVLKGYKKRKTFRKAYNTVNPKKIIAKHYYELIGQFLKKKVTIENKPIKEIWNEGKGWELTTLPHLYDTKDLKKDFGFVPKIPLKRAIEDSIKTYPKFYIPTNEIPVHKRMNLLPRPKEIPWLLK